MNIFKMISFSKIDIEDLEFLNSLRNLYSDEYLHCSKKYSINETYDWFNKTKPNYWIIFYNNIRIGYFRTSNHSLENKNIYIGADILPEFCNKGLATKSYKLFIPFIFNLYDLNKISLEVISTNKRAIHLYKKLGFITEGIKRQEVYKNNKWVDSVIMSILKNEYE